MKKIVKILFLCLLVNFGYAQNNPQIKSSVDTTKIQIGEQIKFTLSILHSQNATVKFPTLKDSIGTFEIVEKSKILSLNKNEKQLKKQDFILTKFDTGMFVIPPLRVEINGQGEYSKPQMIDVIQLPLDTLQKGFYGIKDVIKVPYTFDEIAPYIVGGIILLAILIYIIYKILNRKKKQKPKQKIKLPPAHIQAFSALNILDEKELWQQGKLKKYYSELTDILRYYFERRFNIQAKEYTSDEILENLNPKELSKENYENLKQLLFETDLVKFAKSNPDEHLHKMYRSYVENIIIQTKIEKENE